MLTPYELGREVARIQIQCTKNPKMSIAKAASIADSIGIGDDHFAEFQEGYQNGFTEEMYQEQEPDWIPSAAELDEIERGLNDAVMTETACSKAVMTHGAYFL